MSYASCNNSNKESAVVHSARAEKGKTRGEHVVERYMRKKKNRPDHNHTFASRVKRPWNGWSPWEGNREFMTIAKLLQRACYNLGRRRSKAHVALFFS